MVAAKTTDGAGKDFDRNARWVLLKHKNEPVPLPESEMEFYEPADPKKQKSKNNYFNIKFKNNNLPEFKGTAEVLVFLSNYW